MIKRILVGLGDLPHARTATAAAVEIARATGAEVTGVTLFDPASLECCGPVPIGGGAYARELEEARIKSAGDVIAAVTEGFVASCEQANLKHSVVHETGDPLTQLAADSRYHDLTICGLHGLFEHGVIAEPADQMAAIVKAGVRPLLAVTGEERPVQRVLIAYSGSVESAKTMRRFVQSGLWRDAHLRIVTFQEDAELGRQLLDDAAAYCLAHGLQPHTECVPQAPDHHLLPYADQHKSDLIVMGNSAKNLLLRRIFGETALHAMRNADRPLFLAQ